MLHCAVGVVIFVNSECNIVILNARPSSATVAVEVVNIDRPM